MGTTCEEVQDREHFFRACELKGQIYRKLEMVLSNFLGKDVSFVEVINLAFSHRNVRKFRNCDLVCSEMVVQNVRMMLNFSS